MSLPTSQSKLSVCSASRSGTVSVSVILANERRDAPRPFLGELVDAVFAAAKEVTSVDPVGSSLSDSMSGWWTALPSGTVGSRGQGSPDRGGGRCRGRSRRDIRGTARMCVVDRDMTTGRTGSAKVNTMSAGHAWQALSLTFRRDLRYNAASGASFPPRASSCTSPPGPGGAAVGGSGGMAAPARRPARRDLDRRRASPASTSRPAPARRLHVDRRRHPAVARRPRRPDAPRLRVRPPHRARDRPAARGARHRAAPRRRRAHAAPLRRGDAAGVAPAGRRARGRPRRPGARDAAVPARGVDPGAATATPAR